MVKFSKVESNKLTNLMRKTLCVFVYHFCSKKTNQMNEQKKKGMISAIRMYLVFKFTFYNQTWCLTFQSHIDAKSMPFNSNFHGTFFRFSASFFIFASHSGRCTDDERNLVWKYFSMVSLKNRIVNKFNRYSIYKKKITRYTVAVWLNFTLETNKLRNLRNTKLSFKINK